jgi:2-dehydropantoate 2-reductase
MRILVVGAGVIGSVYASKLADAGNDVVVLARGLRLADLRAQGLIVEDAGSGRRSTSTVTIVRELVSGDQFDLVLVPVRAEQLSGTLGLLTAMDDGSPVMFFGNPAGHQREFTAALGDRALFGFPAVGGVRDGSVVRFVLIGPQATTIGEPDGRRTARITQIADVLDAAGFPTTISARMDDWLTAHAAFVTPIAYALYRDGLDPALLAADRRTLGLMVRATREAFTTLRAAGNAEIPTNLDLLYRWLPTPLAVAYWRHVLAGERGELWFAGHSRAAPEEMRAVAVDLLDVTSRLPRNTLHLDELLGRAATSSAPQSDVHDLGRHSDADG